MQNSSTRFRSKVDAWLALVLLASAIACLGLFVAALITASLLALLILSPIILLGVVLPAWLLRSTYYVLDERDLHVRSGPFRWTVPLEEIREVSPSRSPLAGPALSLDRLRIDYGPGRTILISPEDGSVFRDRLEERRRRGFAGR